MKSRSSIIVIVVATFLGLFLGNGLNGLLGALILGAISAAGAFYVMTQAEKREAVKGTTTVDNEVEDPPFARFLFRDVRAAALWLPIRLFVGWTWLNSGWGKIQDPAWMDSGQAILGFWQRAVAIPETGRPPITYDWWRGVIQGLIDSNAQLWFGKLIAIGETLVGLGLIFGALVGIAAFFGAVMNLSFLLSGTVSTNPIMLISAFLLVLAWKVAGRIGLDRWLLPLLGTPWHGGTLVHKDEQLPSGANTR